MQMLRRISGPVLLVVLVVGLLAGCGGSGGSASSTSATSGQGGAGQPGTGSSAGRATAAAPEVFGSGKPAKLPGGTVARVNGTPITMAAYQHWLSVSAPATVKALIANPSDYSACMAALKSREQQSEKLIKSAEERFAHQRRGHPLLPPRRSHRPTTDAQRKLQCQQQYKAVKQQAVSTLIQRLWTQAEASELGVKASDSEVAKQLKARKAEEAMLASGRRSHVAGVVAELPRYSDADLTELVKSQLLESNVYKAVRERFAQTASVSDQQAEKYFNEHKRFYAQPESRSIVLASTSSKSVAEAIAKEHVSGGLTGAASKHSIKAMPSVMGCEQSVGAGVHLSPLYSAVCSTKSGSVAGPIKITAANYYVVEVKSISAATQPSFSQNKVKIKQMLAMQGQEQAIAGHSQEVRARLKAHTECAAGYVVFSCKEYKPPAPVVSPRGHGR